jgi:lysozyme family protein
MPQIPDAALAAANANRWVKARLTRAAESANVAGRLFKAKGRYQRVEAATGVPWFIIAVIHERESSQAWSASLAQGDPWNRVSVHVPAGRGPFDSWEAAAIDALAACPPFLARHKDWTIGSALAALEAYNGLGYAARGLPSPYLWSGTDQYRAGKFVRDGVFDPAKVDPQLGCVALIRALMALDPTIRFGGVASVPQAPSPKPLPAPPSPPPSIANPAKGSIGAAIAALLAILFKRRS